MDKKLYLENQSKIFAKMYKNFANNKEIFTCPFLNININQNSNWNEGHCFPRNGLLKERTTLVNYDYLVIPENKVINNKIGTYCDKVFFEELYKQSNLFNLNKNKFLRLNELDYGAYGGCIHFICLILFRTFGYWIKKSCYSYDYYYKLIADFYLSGKKSPDFFKSNSLCLDRMAFTVVDNLDKNISLFTPHLVYHKNTNSFFLGISLTFPYEKANIELLLPWGTQSWVTYNKALDNYKNDLKSMSKIITYKITDSFNKRDMNLLKPEDHLYFLGQSISFDSFDLFIKESINYVKNNKGSYESRYSN